MLWILVGLIAAPSFSQDTAPPRGAITVSSPDLAKPVVLAASELAKLPRKVVRVNSEGTQGDYEGVLLADLLKHAQVPLGEGLRGRAIAGQIVVAEAADGQKAVFALAEIDPSFTGSTIILADRLNGKPLSGDEGPWRIVVPGDKRRARWLRQVTAVHVKKI